MSVKGFRVKRTIQEPALLGNIDSIIQEARKNNFIVGNKVDIKAIVKENGIEIQEIILPSAISGILKCENEKWIICVNKNHHYKRQRFTIAHEFGHYVLHRKEGTVYEDTTFFRNNNKSSIEYKANEFAAELLIPEDLLKSAIKNGITKITELAEEFCVSVQAVRFRATELGYNIRSNG